MGTRWQMLKTMHLPLPCESCGCLHRVAKPCPKNLWGRSGNGHRPAPRGR
jgi:hypothetical protein